MDETAPDVSPEIARAQLESAASARIGSGRDRWIHGVGTVVFGLLWGGYFTFSVGSSGPLELTDLALVAGAVLVAAGIYFWKERAGTVPRHAARALNVGMWASFAVVIVLPFVPEPSVDQPWLEVIAAGLIAAPIVLAGVWILIRHER